MSRLEGVFKGQIFFCFLKKFFWPIHFPVSSKVSRIEIYYLLKN